MNQKMINWQVKGKILKSSETVRDSASNFSRKKSRRVNVSLNSMRILFSRLAE